MTMRLVINGREVRHPLARFAMAVVLMLAAVLVTLLVFFVVIPLLGFVLALIVGVILSVLIVGLLAASMCAPQLLRRQDRVRSKLQREPPKHRNGESRPP